MLNLFEAAKRFRNPMAMALFKAIVTEDELFSVLPFVAKEGSAWSYLREKALPAAEFVSPTHTSIAESSATWDEVTVPVREIASDIDIYNFVLAQQNGAAQQSSQLVKKGKAVGRKIADALIDGGYATGFALGMVTNPFNAVDAVVWGPHQDTDRFGPAGLRYTHAGTLWAYRGPGDRTFGPNVAVAADATVRLVSDNPNKFIDITIDVSDATQDGSTSLAATSTTHEPDGLEKMLQAGHAQVRAPVGADGDDFSIAILDELLDLVKVRRNLAFVMNGKLRRKYKSLLRALGGTDPEHIVMPTFDAQGAESQRRVLAYEGVPILKNDNIDNDETVGATTTCSSIYLLSLAAEEGLYAGAFGGGSTEAEVDPVSRAVLGFQFIPVGNLEAKNAQRWRAVWYGGFGLGSELAAGRARGIKTA